MEVGYLGRCLAVQRTHHFSNGAEYTKVLISSVTDEYFKELFDSQLKKTNRVICFIDFKMKYYIFATVYNVFKLGEIDNAILSHIKTEYSKEVLDIVKQGISYQEFLNNSQVRYYIVSLLKFYALSDGFSNLGMFYDKKQDKLRFLTCKLREDTVEASNIKEALIK